MKLGDVCVINPKTPVLDENFTVSFIPMPKVGENGEFDLSDIREYREVKKGFTYFEDGDILFAKITPCMENGKGAVARSMENGIGFGSTEFHVLRPNTEIVISEWIYYLLSWPFFRKEAEKNMTGSAGQKRVPKSFLEDYQVILPTLKEQNQQVDTLQKLDNLISLRKQQLAKLDELVKARFVELFGDPLSNPMGWTTDNMKGICTKITDGEHGSVARVDSGNVFLNAKHIKKDGTIDWQTVTYTSDEVHNKIYARCNPEPGDILLTTTGTIGNVAIVPNVAPFSMDRGITLLKLNRDKVKNIFVAVLLGSEGIQEVMKANVHASAIGHLFLNKVMQIPVILPPIELQEELATFVEQTDKSKSAIQQSLDKLETLKKALMQKYFG